jgi:tetratricopeptide (TPR) repeat protein
MSLLLDALQRASKDKAAAKKQNSPKEFHLSDDSPETVLDAFPELAEAYEVEPLSLADEWPPQVPASTPSASSTGASSAPSLLTETALPTAIDTATSGSPRVANDMHRAYGDEAAAPTAAHPARKRLWWWLGGGAAVLAVAAGVLVWQLLPLISPSSLLASQPAPPAMPGMAPVETPMSTTGSAVNTSSPASPSVVSAEPTPIATPPMAVASATVPAMLPSLPLQPPQTLEGTKTGTATAAAPSKLASRASSPAATSASASGAATARPQAVAAIPAPAAAPPRASTLVQPIQPVGGSIVSRVRGPSTLELAYTALLDGRWADAQRAYQQALASNPQERDALLGLAYLAQRQGQTADARAYYQRTLRLDPDNATARAGLLALGEDAEAPVSASKARDLAQRNPDSASTLATVGAVLVREGLVGEAQQAFARAQQLEPTNVQYAYNHAVALDKLGQRDAALQHYERVLALLKAGHAAAGVQVEAVLQRLGQLRQAGVPPAGAAP